MITSSYTASQPTYSLCAHDAVCPSSTIISIFAAILVIITSFIGFSPHLAMEFYTLLCACYSIANLKVPSNGLVRSIQLVDSEIMISEQSDWSVV